VADTPDWVASMTRVLAVMPELSNRLLVLHVSDGSGRCCACTRAGTGAPSAPWPCAIHIVAHRAMRRHDAWHAAMLAATESRNAEDPPPHVYSH
jgi:hypothetical protein